MSSNRDTAGHVVDVGVGLFMLVVCLLFTAFGIWMIVDGIVTGNSGQVGGGVWVTVCFGVLIVLPVSLLVWVFEDWDEAASDE